MYRYCMTILALLKVEQIIHYAPITRQPSAVSVAPLSVLSIEYCKAFMYKCPSSCSILQILWEKSSLTQARCKTGDPL